MKVEDLKQWTLVYKAYKKNANELFKTKNTPGLTWKEYKKTKKFKEIDSAFIWEGTKEGYEFWESLHNDDVETAKALWSELFYIDNQAVEDQVEGYTLSAHTEYIIALASGSVVLENSCSLDEIKSTMEELEYYYNTVKGIGCSIIACYHSDGSGKLVRCDAGGNNPIVLMSWGRCCE